MKSIISVAFLASFLSAQAMADCGSADQFSYCTGNSVITDKGSKGKVAGVLQNGKVMVRFDAYSRLYKWPTSRLAVSKGCSKNGPFCVGSRIISDKGVAGMIEGIFQNGEVSIKFASSSRFYKWKTSRLAIRRGCTFDDYCVDDKIINDKGVVGVVEGVFQNGEVSIQFSRNSRFYKWQTSRLAITDACTERETVYFE